jgi:hypothetical protein
MKLLTIAASLLLGGVVHAQQRIPVVTAPRASAVEALAAGELSRYLAKIYPGRSFPVGTALPAAGPAILVGTPQSQPELRRVVAAQPLQGPESFVVSTTARGAERIGLVAGADPRGVLYGVYALLEKLGCGFYLSYDALAPPQPGSFTFDGWELADAPLAADRILFDWHNFLSSASTWELEDWQRYIDQGAKLRYNTIMVHAYGNNPMFTFRFAGQTKPVGYLATTRSGRDWGTQHVNDVRRLYGGEVFNSPVFGSSVASVPEAERAAAAMALMKKVFAYARGRGMHVTFALDVDTPAASPQSMMETLPPGARLTGGKYQLANPDTAEGYAYYRAQVRQLLEAYPEIDRLAVWFRRAATPWREMELSQFPPAWRKEFAAALERHPWMREDKNAHGMFAISKLVRAFGRALREEGRPDVELATGSWTFLFMRSADVFLPREVTLLPFDNHPFINPVTGRDQLHAATIFHTDAGREMLRTAARSGRKLIPIVWAHEDDHAYVGRPFLPFRNFMTMLRERDARGFAIIHWTTRPLDLYFKSLGEQVWKATENQPLETTCQEMATRSFGASARATGGEYLLRWVNDSPLIGRETGPRFIDVPLKEPEVTMERTRERLALLEKIDGTAAESREWLSYFRDYERFMLAFFQSHRALEIAQEAAARGAWDEARGAIAKSDPEAAIIQFAQAARRGSITRGEQALVVSLNLRWLPQVVSARQAAGVDAVRIKFGPTQHEALAQSAGTNTFYFDADRKVWKVIGEKETGAPVFELGAGGDERVRTGLRLEKPLVLPLGPMMGGNLKPGRYKLELLMVQPSAAGEGVVQVELGAVKDSVDVAARAGGKDKLLSLTYTVEIAGAPELTLRPVRGAVYAGGVSLTPAASLK